ncbi:MAG: hypothetical protein ACPL7M_08640, partial [Bryobacteraceae bacterium]
WGGEIKKWGQTPLELFQWCLTPFLPRESARILAVNGSPLGHWVSDPIFRVANKGEASTLGV